MARCNKDKICDRCGNEFECITTCHMRCHNCGAELDCSDKGSVW